jgi:hypothetical protein
MRLTVVALAAVMVVGVVAPAAADERVAVEWIQATCRVDPGDTTASGGALHVRGEGHHDVIWMDLGSGYMAVGTNTISFNYDVSLATLNGRGGGTFLANMPALGSTFAGHFNGGIKGGLLTAQAVGDGGGAMAGAKMTARIVQFQPSSAQLGWLCDGGDVTKAVAVSALIRP